MKGDKVDRISDEIRARELVEHFNNTKGPSIFKTERKDKALENLVTKVNRQLKDKDLDDEMLSRIMTKHKFDTTDKQKLRSLGKKVLNEILSDIGDELAGIMVGV